MSRAASSICDDVPHEGRKAAVKIRSVKPNNRRKAFGIRAGKRPLTFPYSKTDPQPTPTDPVSRVVVDEEIGREGFTYVLESGREGAVHIDDVLEYNEDPSYVRDALLYRLTIEAQKRLDNSRLSRREVIRCLGTSPAQLYRLLDQKNYRKSIDQLVSLLRILDCDVDFVVRGRTA
jgi:hypothetical protein